MQLYNTKLIFYRIQEAVSAVDTKNINKNIVKLIRKEIKKESGYIALIDKDDDCYYYFNYEISILEDSKTKKEIIRINSEDKNIIWEIPNNVKILKAFIEYLIKEAVKP